MTPKGAKMTGNFKAKKGVDFLVDWYMIFIIQ